MEDGKDSIHRLPLPKRSKAQMEADSDSDLDDGDIPGLDLMLDKFKKLQAKASKSSLGEYLELPKTKLIFSQSITTHLIFSPSTILKCSSSL